MMPSEWERDRRARDVVDLMEKEMKKYLNGFEETILKTKEFLKRKKCFEKGSFDYRDTEAWVEAWDKNTEAMIVRNYNCTDWRFLFLFEKSSRGIVISCYQLFSDWHDSLENRKPKDFIRHADSIYRYYTDNIEGIPYVHRPNLAFFKEHYKEMDTDKFFHFKPLFQITKLKKSFLMKIKDIHMLFDMQKELGLGEPFEKDGYLIDYNTKNACVNYNEMNLACFYMCRILESKEYAD